MSIFIGSIPLYHSVPKEIAPPQPVDHALQNLESSGWISLTQLQQARHLVQQTPDDPLHTSDTLIQLQLIWMVGYWRHQADPSDIETALLIEDYLVHAKLLTPGTDIWKCALAYLTCHLITPMCVKTQGATLEQLERLQCNILTTLQATCGDAYHVTTLLASVQAANPVLAPITQTFGSFACLACSLKYEQHHIIPSRFAEIYRTHLLPILSPSIATQWKEWTQQAYDRGGSLPVCYLLLVQIYVEVAHTKISAISPKIAEQLGLNIQDALKHATPEQWETVLRLIIEHVDAQAVPAEVQPITLELRFHLISLLEKYSTHQSPVTSDIYKALSTHERSLHAYITNCQRQHLEKLEQAKAHILDTINACTAKYSALEIYQGILETPPLIVQYQAHTSLFHAIAMRYLHTLQTYHDHHSPEAIIFCRHTQRPISDLGRRLTFYAWCSTQHQDAVSQLKSLIDTTCHVAQHALEIYTNSCVQTLYRSYLGWVQLLQKQAELASYSVLFSPLQREAISTQNTIDALIPSQQTMELRSLRISEKLAPEDLRILHLYLNYFPFPLSS